MSYRVITLVTLLLVLVWRIGGEEGLMQQEFGQEWQDYRRTSCV